MQMRAGIRMLGMVSVLVATVGAGQGPDDAPIRGFTAEGAREQRALEARFDAVLSGDSLEAWMRRMSARPHHVGSPFGKENAEFMAAQFRSWGYDVMIERYDVLFPTPRERVLELTAPTRYRAKLAEPAVEGDPTSRVTRDRLPVYNAYAADGDVTGELVYVNYGVPADYEVLAKHGIDVRGKIVLARYGGSWRGIKPKVAAEHGAIGCIIYSDPRDDGYAQGGVYPEGPFRPPLGAQRGSVEDMPLYPGDPLTPGVGATPDAHRLPRDSAPTLTTIPVLPIGYEDARPLLAALSGPVVPEAWRGALGLTYRMGPGPATVHLKLAFDWNQVPAYDVIATARGIGDPDAWIVRGNHHDGWVFGAGDPLSGMVALMEEARAIGALMATGWRPQRTIVFAAWDGEEPGLLGSTEWGEAHAEELRRHAVAYINTDGYGRGFLGVGGSHTLERFVNEVARDVQDPETGVSVAARRRALLRVQGQRDEATARDLPIEPLGSGSDWTVFLQHLGVASLNVGYGGENAGGEYHSIYDSFEHFTRFGDPGFVYGVVQAQTTGRMTLRLAEADLLPFRFTNFARHVRRYGDEVMALADAQRAEAEERAVLLATDAYRLAADPTRVSVPPPPLATVPHLNWAPLQDALDRLGASAARADSALEAQPLGERTARLRAINALLVETERAMTADAGLPRRPWFTHQIYAPGFYTGYGVKTLPGIREAVEQRYWPEADAEIRVVAGALARVSDVLQEIAGTAESR